MHTGAESLNCVQFVGTPWPVACQTPPSMGFPRQEYWSGLLFSTPGDLPNPGIEHMPLASPVLADRFFPTVPFGKPKVYLKGTYCEITNILLSSLSFRNIKEFSSSVPGTRIDTKHVYIIS